MIGVFLARTRRHPFFDRQEIGIRGSFLRLKNVEMGYTMPKSLTSLAKMDMLRIYINVSNPMVWSKFKIWDVEMAGNGMGYPIQRVVNLGLNVSL